MQHDDPSNGKNPAALLFVCMGNICRSPVAEAIARARFAKAGLTIRVDSAGTENYHIGSKPDARALASAKAHGYDASQHRARQACADDFDSFAMLLVMDRINLRALRAMAPPDKRAKIALFLPFAGIAAPEEVPDPYYGQAADFERVIILAERGVDGLIAKLRAQAALPCIGQ